MKLLEKDPARRYASARQVLAGLTQAPAALLPLHGRQPEVDVILERTSSLVSLGVGGVIWVHGPPGSGRSRLLQEIMQPRGIWLRTEKGMRAAEGLDVADGLVSGEAPPRPMFIKEHGLRYEMDVVEGQKTGFFVDQRDNRLAAANYADGKRVLDVCCYTGGFSLNVLQHGGAISVRGIDQSEAALQLARNNAELNGLGSRAQFEKQDAFQALEQARDAGEKYGMIILDPPKMARQGKAVEGALRGYHMLNRMAIECLEPGGILVTCSCSGHVSREMFEDMLAEAALSADRRLQILESRGAAADHPTLVSCMETNYLKCCICRVA